MRGCSASRIRVHSGFTLSSASSPAMTRSCRRPYSAQAVQTVTRPTQPQGPILHETIRVSNVPPTTRTRPDPHQLVAPQLAYLKTSLLNLLGSSHPSLAEAGKYYFMHPSKQLRPLLVLLFSQATNGLGDGFAERRWKSECEGALGRTEELDSPLTRPDVLNDFNPYMPDTTASFSDVFSLQIPHPSPPLPTPPRFDPLAAPILSNTILPSQVRLAQIVEMLHVSSLLHDDVVDMSPLRRGAPSAPIAFGTKLTVLAGDFLLARISTAVARLRDYEVMELLSSIIANLVEGEILQMKVARGEDRSKAVFQDAWNTYLQKTYLKTASLMAKGMRAAAVLGGCRDGEVWKEIAYAYGRNLGIAFQLVDDILDYENGEATMGKPGGADLHLGLATGPALYAWEEFPEMGPMIVRKFSEKGDVERARELVRKSAGLERTRELAKSYADKANEVLAMLPESEAKSALEALTDRMVRRKS